LLETRLEASRPVYEEAKVQYDQLKARLAQYKPLDLPALEAVLAPVKAALVVQEALIQEIEVQRQGLVITAPIDGVITSIHRLPGQTVLAGDPVVTIAQPDSRYVISYVRERQRIGLYEGMEVGLRLRGAPGSPEYISSVEVVGPQVASVPPHQLSDQSIPEWATPIKIPLPPEMRQEGLRPGQLVQVIFRSARR
jgi:multidrug resistance efflux pump